VVTADGLLVRAYFPPERAPEEVVTAADKAGGYQVVDVRWLRVTAPKSVGDAPVAEDYWPNMQREPLVLS